MNKGVVTIIWLILFFVIAVGIGSLNIPTYIRLVRHCESVNGTVVEIAAKYHNTVRYQYSVANVSYSGQTQPEGLANSLRVGEKITVYYDETRPSLSVLRNPRGLLQNEVISVMLAAALMPTIILIGIKLRLSRKTDERK